ncbi:uncharacterized protein EV420DRAFT_1645011 [Desarmillaria tabescens]|uniref:Uncharacterized protein n=1 Tax=Armillaria tabescens TaxID=1929756 RepID=A0AA39N164_ARMTA|nr:uncharacterized protein EV420DRAFT_1645011 [Desarmillaria tabescens]KAK0454157.1 hypothetical protein EV420DRAFT_1645011 [Desarmillaria tabescens]
MTENLIGTRVWYLFWEAECSITLTTHVSQGPIVPFDPSSRKFKSKNSLGIGIAHTMAYLDDALLALGLLVEARTSFIIYWLPSISKHEYILLKFLPQNSYQQAASLEIEHKPDIVTTVFMLFKRVCEDEFDEWDEAHLRISDGVAFWRGIVGVNEVKMGDEGLFKVLEWGGMEVHP